MNKSDKPLSTLWGCELSEANKEKTFSTEESNLQHQLAVRSMCLGHTAKDEFNIIELVTGSGKEATEGIPVATLHAKSMPTVNLTGVELHPPVTFRLKFGSGPVHICAEHVAFEEDLSDEELEEEEEEEEVEDEEEIEVSPEKPVKKQAAKNGGPVKRKKPEKAVDSTLSDDENNPPKKGKGRGRKPQAQKV
ncbi:nucleoplasmin-2b [Clupea harengus]|uniref:Nucleoplasmin-2b n=1 Tax=Clupea harengus TaxID=7950 RepID=A0A6P3VE06_CLUHA|nr:nucleoplasmin-2b [Clupea harengus]